MMSKFSHPVYFVSGIDTDSGKSVATGMIARYFYRNGVSVITQKLVQTGNTQDSEDIIKHREIMGCGFFPEDVEHLTAPVIYHYPCSPHLAAELDAKPLNFAAINNATEKLRERFELILLEGAGGLMVPLTRKILTADFIEAHHYPLLLVVSGKLGAINHALLSLEVAVKRKIEVAGMVFNDYPDNDRIISEDAKGILREMLHQYAPNGAFVELPVVDWKQGNFGDFDPSPLFGTAAAGLSERI